MNAKTKDTIDAVRKRAGVSAEEAKRMVDAVSSAVADMMADRKDAKLPGVGTIVLEHKKARKARNPQTGEEIEIAAKTVMKLKPEKFLRDLIA